MSFPSRRKSLAISLDILFHFVLPSSMCRVGGWRSKSEWREEGIGGSGCFCCSAKRERVDKREGSSMHVVWIPYYLLF
jgi:hypothetical protein